MPNATKWVTGSNNKKIDKQQKIFNNRFLLL